MPNPSMLSTAAQIPFIKVLDIYVLRSLSGTQIACSGKGSLASASGVQLLHGIADVAGDCLRCD